MAKTEKTPTPHVLALMDTALDLQEKGKARQAHELLLNAQAQCANYAPLALLLGLSYLELKEPVLAEEQLREALDLQPDFMEARQALGLLLLSKGSTSEAVTVLNPYVQVHPEDALTLRAWGKGMLELGKLEDVRAVTEKAWQTTRTVETGIVYGRLLIRLGNYREAERVFRTLIAQAPDLPRLRAELAYALTLQQHWQDATDVLIYLTQEYPEYDRAWRGLAEIYLHAQKPDQALAAAEQALAIDDQHYRNWLVKANALAALDKPAEAVQAARAGLACEASDDVDADAVRIQLRLIEAQSLLNMYEIDSGLDALAELCESYPQDPSLVFFHFRTLMTLFRYKEAIDVLDSAVSRGTDPEQLAPEYYQAWHLLGEPSLAWQAVKPYLDERRLDHLAQIGVFLYIQGNIPTAQAVFQQLVDYAPQFARVSCNLGYILIGEGQLDEAEKYLEQAEAYAEDDFEGALIAANLGMIALLQGRFAESERYFQQTQALAPMDAEAMERIAYFYGGRILPGYTEHPRRTLPLKLAAQANLITLALAQKNLDEAQAMAEELLAQAPDRALGYEMMGWVHLTQGNNQEAVASWQRALELADDSEAMNAYRLWLQELVS